MSKIAKVAKQRLDLLLVERGLAESRQKAQAMILAGQVRVGGQKSDKAGALIAVDCLITIAGGDRYASRGGWKLAGALTDFNVDPEGRICLDAGSSAGGFTDCLLQRGAVRVYAVDVNTSQLNWKLQSDPRVVRIDANARYLQQGAIAEAVSMVTVDLSFISVSKVLRALTAVASPGAVFLILVKPQFELERGEVGRGGIVRDPTLHERAVDRIRAAAQTVGLRTIGVCPSQLPGAEGNQEFFLYARLDAGPETPPNLP